MKAITLALVFLVACGSDGPIDDYIGATCDRDSDCADRCYQGGAYPEGFCSTSCDSDADCPSEAVCINRDGGVCLFLCSELDCGRLGKKWKCEDRENVGGGKDAVCIGD